jgi:hypothetical protein
MDPAVALAVQVASAVAEWMNMLGLLAAPRALAEHTWCVPAAELRAHFVEGTNAFVAATEPLLARGGAGAAHLGPLRAHAIGLRGLLGRWRAGAAPPASVVARARAAVASLGVPAPPGGWDDWLPGPA